MKTIERDALERTSSAARESARLRMNANLHQMDDGIHRLLNATEPGTYVRPHRHTGPDKLETLTVLCGRGALLVFDDAGAVLETAELSPDGPCFVAEIAPGEWHTLLALEPGTVWFEVKAGPYAALPPEDLAPWSPATDDAAAVELYLARLAAACGA